MTVAEDEAMEEEANDSTDEAMEEEGSEESNFSESDSNAGGNFNDAGQEGENDGGDGADFSDEE